MRAYSARSARKATPRGQHSHLYAWQSRASTREASTGIHPTACVASHTVRAPTRAAAAPMASRSATSPEPDCTSEKATRSVSAAISSARVRSGTARTSMPRPAWTKGSTSEENSSSGTSTRAPLGSAAASSETCAEVWEPIATRSGATPTRRAKCERDASTARLYPATSGRPARSAVIARRVPAVGSPAVQAARYPVAAGASAPRNSARSAARRSVAVAVAVRVMPPASAWAYSCVYVRCRMHRMP